MARIAGVNVPTEKVLEIALRYIYGIGPKRSSLICEEAGIAAERRVKTLSEDELSRLRSVIEGGGYELEGDLRRRVRQDIKRKVDLGSYEGLRHRKGLPVHGQRTSSNAQTCKRVRRPQADKRG